MNFLDSKIIDKNMILSKKSFNIYALWDRYKKNDCW